MSTIPIAYGKLADDVTLTRAGEALSINIMSTEKINLLQRVIDRYLNTHAEADKWLFDLSDALNPVPVPARQEGWK